MIVALTGLVVSLFAYLIAFPDRDRRRFDVYLPLLLLHVAMAVAYWLYHFEAAMDAFTYYRDPYNFYQQFGPLSSGTHFITWVVQTLRSAVGGSFLDYFLLFQCFGMIGFALLIRSFIEVADSLQTEVPWLLYLLLFLPGLHFWSVAIGKDAPMFMAVALAVWASIRIGRRFVWMALAVAAMLLIRPHVGAVVMLAVFVAFITARGVSPITRLVLIPPAIAGLVATLLMAGEQLGIDFSDAETVTDFVQYQQGLNETMGSGASIASLPFPLKVFTLLFRPLFFDAAGAMAYAVSFENVALLFLFGALAAYWRDLFRLMGRVYHVTFCAVFSVTLIIGLSLVNYNLGLGQRQKMMVMPAVLLIFATIYLYRRYLAAAAQAAALEPGPEPARPAVAAGARQAG